MGFPDDFDNPSLAAATLRLPVFYHRLLAAKSSCSPNPKNTRSCKPLLAAKRREALRRGRPAHGKNAFTLPVS